MTGSFENVFAILGASQADTVGSSSRDQRLRCSTATDLDDARIPALSPDQRLACCYNAILTAARAVLRSAGYRVPEGTTNHHYYATQSLQFTALLDVATVQQIESMGKKRVMADYVRVGEVSQSMVEEALAFAETCCHRVTDWIRETHPEFYQG